MRREQRNQSRDTRTQFRVVIPQHCNARVLALADLIIRHPAAFATVAAKG